MATDDARAWAAAMASSVPPGTDPASVLAALADALEVPWDGSATRLPSVPALPAGVPGWVVLDAAREALLDVGARRRLGAHHTPPALARRLVDLALAGFDVAAPTPPTPARVVCDPACGGGAFLVAAADALVGAGAEPAAVVAEQLVGFDLDPLAVATTRAALRCWARDHGVADVDPVGVVLGDGLAAAWDADIDVVVGNPPFLSPLGTDTAGGPIAVALRQQMGAPYADVAGLFLLRAIERVRPGGRVVLIQPESLLSSRDARRIRDAAAPHLVGLWVAGEPVFAASVRVCAPVLERQPDAAPRSTATVRRWRGAAVRATGRVALDPAAATWSHLRPSTTPVSRRRRPKDGPTVGDLATATAGFRDEFYAIAAVVIDVVTDDGLGPGAFPVVTSGLIDPGRCAWGERPARIAGARYAAPVVRPDDLQGRVRTWAEARLVPKVLVATQTKVIEAAPDPDGRYVPLTPVLAVVPHDPNDPNAVWQLAAALTDPAVTAWASNEFGGTALSSEAVKLSAKQVLAAPLPDDEQAWAAATERLRRGDVVGCAEALAGDDGQLLEWWRGRLR